MRQHSVLMAVSPGIHAGWLCMYAYSYVIIHTYKASMSALLHRYMHLETFVTEVTSCVQAAACRGRVVLRVALDRGAQATHAGLPGQHLKQPGPRPMAAADSAEPPRRRPVAWLQ